jgi:DNA-binding NtrC family response regulator
MRRITVSHGPERRSLCLPPGHSARLGSAPDNDLVTPFAGVSRHHARLESGDGGVLVIDLGSKNGLVCDGHRYENLLLTPGRSVHIGHAVLELEEVAAADVDLSLRFATPPRPPGPAGTAEPPREAPTQETRELPDTTASPAPALRLVHRLGRGGPPADEAQRAELLDEARRAAEAEWLALLRLDGGGDLTTSAWCGALAHDGELATLEAALAAGGVSPRRAGRFELAERFVLAAAAGGPAAGAAGGAWIAAAFPAGRRPATWVEELLACLGEHLQPAAAERATDAAAGGELRLPDGMVVGDSPAMAHLLDQLRATVRSDLSVLICGETGVGKELVARLIHRSGPQAEGPFVAVNCAAIPGELLEAELFGVAARVATGVDPRPGLFLRADGGTLFLDEIGEMPERLQAKLLRVLQEREVWPVGRGRPRPVDVRVLAASNRDLTADGEGRFRRDLYFRLCGLLVQVPPLRRRREDLPPLIHSLAARAAAKYDKPVAGVTRAALGLLLAHPWPGNVRELENAVENAVLLCPRGGALETVHFPTLLAAAPGPPRGSGDPAAGGDGTPAGPPPAAGGTGAARFRPLQERIDEVEREAIRQALAATGGVKSRAAGLLGITRNGLALKLERLGIDV